MGLKTTLNGNFKFLVTILITLTIASIPTIGGWYSMRIGINQNAKDIIRNHEAALTNHLEQSKLFQQHCVSADNKMQKINDYISVLDKSMTVIKIKQDTVIENQNEFKTSIGEVKDLIRNRN